MYILQIDDKIPISNYLNVLTEKNSSCLWNLKLSDINKYKIIRMSSSGLIQQVSSNDFDTCESCIKGKMTSKSFSKPSKSS
jgi:hypothetical protein